MKANLKMDYLMERGNINLQMVTFMRGISMKGIARKKGLLFILTGINLKVNFRKI